MKVSYKKKNISILKIIWYDNLIKITAAVNKLLSLFEFKAYVPKKFYNDSLLYRNIFILYLKPRRVL